MSQLRQEEKEQSTLQILKMLKPRLTKQYWIQNHRKTIRRTKDTYKRTHMHTKIHTNTHKITGEKQNNQNQQPQ